MSINSNEFDDEENDLPNKKKSKLNYCKEIKINQSKNSEIVTVAGKSRKRKFFNSNENNILPLPLANESQKNKLQFQKSNSEQNPENIYSLSPDDDILECNTGTKKIKELKQKEQDPIKIKLNFKSKNKRNHTKKPIEQENIAVNVDNNLLSLEQKSIEITDKIDSKSLSLATENTSVHENKRCIFKTKNNYQNQDHKPIKRSLKLSVYDEFDDDIGEENIKRQYRNKNILLQLKTSKKQDISKKCKEFSSSSVVSNEKENCSKAIQESSASSETNKIIDNHLNERNKINSKLSPLKENNCIVTSVNNQQENLLEEIVDATILNKTPESVVLSNETESKELIINLETSEAANTEKQNKDYNSDDKLKLSTLSENQNNTLPIVNLIADKSAISKLSLNTKKSEVSCKSSPFKQPIRYYPLTYTSLGLKSPQKIITNNLKRKAIESLSLKDYHSKKSHKENQKSANKFQTNIKNNSDKNNNNSNIDENSFSCEILGNKGNSRNNISGINISNNNLNRIENMSVYDRRIQADDRLNGYTSTRGLQHNDDTTSNSVMNNHYYQCSPPPQIPQHPTMATLCNIGNTCYLNSVVYTLRFAPMFLHNLHHLVDDLLHVQQNVGKHHLKSSSLGRNISGLHMENTRSWSSKDLASLENTSCDMPKSNQQIATEKLHELYESLHRNEFTENTEPFHADTFLHAIQDVSAIFEGNQQQDAHEFLMCVLDSIRETCQSLIKAISDCPEMITNGCISLPKQQEPQSVIKEKSLQRDTTAPSSSSSSSSTIIKTSFFSRKSKRKDGETKTSKNSFINSISNSISMNSNNSSSNNTNNRIHSPHKDNIINQQQQQQTQQQQKVTLIDGNSNSNANCDATGGFKDYSLSQETESVKDSKEQLSDKIKRLGLDFFTEDFEGITVSTTKCLSCETITEQKETMIDIAVPITSETAEDEKFIQKSCVTTEYFRGENKYRCEKCMGYTEAIRSISYEVLPRLLVIQLSRFSGVMEKINTYLPTPFTLQCFCSKCLDILSSISAPISSSSSSTLGSSNCENKNLHVYKLYSVITHVGATMSVGHYIAYTCSLDWANDYINCPRDRMRQAQVMKQQQKQQQQQQQQVNAISNNLQNGPEKNQMKSMKKMIFGRSKASSSGDMSKTMKTLNGLSSKATSSLLGSSALPCTTTSTTTTTATTTISAAATTSATGNGTEKCTISNSICPSINCCGLQLKNNYLLNANLNNYNGSSSNSIGYHSASSSIQHNNSNSNCSRFYGGDYDEQNYYHHIQQTTTSSYNIPNYNIPNASSSNSGSSNSINRNRQQNEPIWYMCDDDKIKAMSQLEFEDMLSPNRKIMITPYLLFYARNDLH